MTYRLRCREVRVRRLCARSALPTRSPGLPQATGRYEPGRGMAPRCSSPRGDFPMRDASKARTGIAAERMQMPVCVLDKRKDPLMPCLRKGTRLFVGRGKAVRNRRISCAISIDNQTLPSGRVRRRITRRRGFPPAPQTDTCRGEEDAAAVNTARWAFVGLVRERSVDIGSGGGTKFHEPCSICLKVTGSMPCVSEFSGKRSCFLAGLSPFGSKDLGAGSYQRTRVDPSGFPRAYLPRQKQYSGFQTQRVVDSRCADREEDRSLPVRRPFACWGRLTSRLQRVWSRGSVLVIAA